MYHAHVDSEQSEHREGRNAAMEHNPIYMGADDAVSDARSEEALRSVLPTVGIALESGNQVCLYIHLVDVPAHTL